MPDRFRTLSPAELKRFAYLDAVTGLPNRQAVLDAIAATTSAARVGELSGLIAVSADEHSEVCDAFGFDSGERLIKRLAAELQSVADPHLVVAIGSDRFGVFVSRLGVQAEAANVVMAELVERIIDGLSGNVDLGAGVVVDASVSVGYAMARRGATESGWLGTACIDASDPADLVTCAEVARKHAVRGGGRRRARHFEPHMLEAARERMRIVSDLRNGIEHGELRLFAQPIVGPDRGMIGYEGLVRWQPAGREQIPPALFIPLAEQTGAIIEIGEWVLDAACRTLGDWARHDATRDWSLAINVSERQLKTECFAAAVLDAAGRYGAPPERLCLEFTEGVLHTDLDRTVRFIEELREAGVSFSLDDFGTGYSSLDYLRRLPLQTLKIDRSFIETVDTDPRSLALVRTMVRLGDDLGLEVVAEGIETEAQFAALSALDVQAFQGFLFGVPRPIEECLAA